MKSVSFCNAFSILLELEKSSRENHSQSMASFLQRLKTPASFLLQNTFSTEIFLEFWKYLIIFSAFEPAPEAKIITLFICKIFTYKIKHNS